MTPAQRIANTLQHDMLRDLETGIENARWNAEAKSNSHAERRVARTLLILLESTQSAILKVIDSIAQDEAQRTSRDRNGLLVHLAPTLVYERDAAPTPLTQ